MVMKKFTFLTVLLVVFIFGAFKTYAQYDCAGGRFRDSIYPVQVKQNVLYGHNDNYDATPQDLTMDIYTPIGDVHTKRPLIIFAPKGSFMSEDNKEWVLVQLCTKLASMGYTTASINYRVGLNYFATDLKAEFVKAVVRAVHDYKAAIRYFRKDAADSNKYKVDTNVMISGGSSAGAITAIHAAYLKNAAQVLPFMDTTGIAAQGGIEGLSGNQGFSSKVHYVVNLCGAIADTAWIEAGMVPITSMHGDLDTEVPYTKGFPMGISLINMQIYGSYNINLRAEHLGINNPFYIFPGQTHIPYDPNAGGDYKLYMDTVITFVKNQLCNFICGTALNVSEKAENDNNISIYPNPVSNVLNVKFDGEMKDFSLKLFDITGKEIYSEVGLNATAFSVKKINTEGMAIGLYILKIQNSNTVKTVKFVVD
jgi:hypothetical protein